MQIITIQYRNMNYTYQNHKYQQLMSFNYIERRSIVRFKHYTTEQENEDMNILLQQIKDNPELKMKLIAKLKAGTIMFRFLTFSEIAHSILFLILLRIVL